MPNLIAKDGAGDLKYFASTHANTDLDPAESQETVVDAVEAGNALLSAIQGLINSLTTPSDAQTVSGTVAVSNQISGFATQATLALVLSAVQSLTKPGDTQIVGGAVSVTNLPATQPVSGSVSVDNQISGFATQTTLASVLAAIQALTKPTDTQTVDGSVAVSNQISGFATQTTLAAVLSAIQALTKPADTQTVGGSVSITNLPATQPVSAASLPLPAGAATETTVNKLFAGTAKTRASGIKSTSGDGSAIIAAPGSGNEIIISHLHLQLSATPASTQVAILKGGTGDANGFGVVCDAITDGFSGTFPPGNELRMGNNQAVFLNLANTTSVRYFIQYRIGAVL